MAVSAAKTGPGPGNQPVRCAHCGATVDESDARRYPDVERLGCMACGVQLIRRPGQPWETIRG